MTVEQVATGGPGDGAVRRSLAPLGEIRTLTGTIYLLLSMWVGLTWHVVLAVGLTLGLGTMIIWVGVFVLALTPLT